MKVCLVIPVHNEEIILADNVGLLSAWMREHHADLDWRIVIADNGSADRTPEICRQLAAATERCSPRIR